MRISICFSNFLCKKAKSEVWHLQKYQLSYFSKQFKDLCLEREKYLISTFSWINSRIEYKHMRISTFSIIFPKCKKRSLSPSKISIIIFFKKIPRFQSRTSKILNFHVFLKNIPKLKTNTCEFYFFNFFVKKQKVKSNTFKIISYPFLQNNPKISVQNVKNT